MIQKLVKVTRAMSTIISLLRYGTEQLEVEEMS